jgi:solute carrier family 25 S-adenosylmethionine transporter 26
MLVFGTYEKMKQYHKNNIINAIFSDFCGSLFLSPCEVIKQNIQIGKYKTIYEVIKYENKRMYKGYSALLLRDIPFRSIQLPLYDKLKNNTEPNAIHGAIAGMTAGFLTNPIDVIKTKLMCTKYHTHVIKIIPYIYKTEGFLGFFKGIIYRTIYLGLSSSIFFLIYEKLRRFT